MKMVKRLLELNSNECSNKKRNSVSPITVVDMKPGEILTDLGGRQWKLGETVGVGGFGQIFVAFEIVNGEIDSNCEYVAKVETHSSGPLFVEINCYLRIAKKELIEMWKSERNIASLGMPYYVASGSHQTKTSKYRFLIIPRFKCDIEQKLNKMMYGFNLKTVLTIGMQLLDTLEYIHSKGYVHCDIKASNVLLNQNSSTVLKENKINSYFMLRYGHRLTTFRRCRMEKLKVKRELRPNKRLHQCNDNSEDKIAPSSLSNQFYLLDFGLVTKYLQSNGEHRKYCTDERRAHAGTILFCSLDAHKGAQSRRSDLESLGYNLVYWLTRDLPWKDETDNPTVVHRIKQKCLQNLHQFLSFSFSDKYPQFLYDYFKYLVQLDFEAKPDYDYCRNLMQSAFKQYNLKSDSCSLFTDKHKLIKKKLPFKQNVQREMAHVSYVLNRAPLTTNSPMKAPKLRRERKNKEARIHWSKILKDPEGILKQNKSRERKLTEGSDTGISNLDVWQLNPTYAMLEVFFKSIERMNNSGHSPKYKGDDNFFNSSDYIKGYTSAMMAVHNQKKEREEMEIERFSINDENNFSTSSSNNQKRKDRNRSSKAQTCKSSPENQSLKKIKMKVTNVKSYRLKG